MGDWIYWSLKAKLEKLPLKEYTTLPLHPVRRVSLGSPDWPSLVILLLQPTKPGLRVCATTPTGRAVPKAV